MRSESSNVYEMYTAARELLSKGSYGEAVVEFQKISDIADEQGESYICARAINDVGVAYDGIGNDSMAFDYYVKGLEYAKNHDVKECMHMLYNNIGTKYHGYGAYEKALKYYLMAEANMIGALEENKENATYFISTYMNIGDSYRNVKNFLEAEIYLRKAKNLIERYGIDRDDLFCAVLYSRLLQEKGEVEAIRNHLEKMMDKLPGYSEYMPDYSSCVKEFFTLLIDLEEYEYARKVLETYEEVISKYDSLQFYLQLTEHYMTYYRCIEDLENYRNACVEHAEYYFKNIERGNQNEIDRMDLKVRLSQIESDMVAARKKAETDALTGLKNRHALNCEVESLFYDCIKNEKPFLIGIVDIDCFKQYNDIYGHLQGDKVLVTVATKLKKIVSGYGDVYRFGGDEFVVVIDSASTQVYKKIAEQMSEAFKEAGIVNLGSNVENYLTISQGYCVGVPRDGQIFAEYMNQADDSLYSVKRNGKNGYNLNEYKE